MKIERTAKLRERYNAEEDRFQTEGTCPFCHMLTVALDEDTVLAKCEHYDSMRWGCGGAIFFYTRDKT